jgi:hypothetical protein
MILQNINTYAYEQTNHKLRHRLPRRPHYQAQPPGQDREPLLILFQFIRNQPPNPNQSQLQKTRSVELPTIFRLSTQVGYYSLDSPLEKE